MYTALGIEERVVMGTESAEGLLNRYLPRPAGGTNDVRNIVVDRKCEFCSVFDQSPPTVSSKMPC